MKLPNGAQAIIPEGKLEDYCLNPLIQIHDYVAVLADIENTPIARGTTGTVVSKLSDTHFLVEFSDNEGQVYEQAAIHADNLLVLHQITENLEVD
jgi:hypothetical protein